MPDSARPWELTVTVNGRTLNFRRPWHYGTRKAAMNCADRMWIGAFCTVKHAVTGEHWERRRGQWQRVEAVPSADRRPLPHERFAP